MKKNVVNVNERKEKYHRYKIGKRNCRHYKKKSEERYHQYKINKEKISSLYEEKRKKHIINIK